MRMRTVSAAFALLLAAAAGLRAGAAEPRVVRIVAKRFTYTPSEITLKKGEPVVLELVSEDRVHGFKLPAFKLRTDVRHDDMTGTLIVTE